VKFPPFQRQEPGLELEGLSAHLGLDQELEAGSRPFAGNLIMEWNQGGQENKEGRQ